MRWKRAASLALLLLLSPIVGGCYLGHLAAGQTRLLWARQPIEPLLEDPATPPELRQRLERVGEVRSFARVLGLEVGGQYTTLAHWPGDFVIVSVVATRPGEVEALTSWFPIVGSVPYRGFFDAERASRHAERLRAKGLDACELKVPAYSTLGWFDDPLTGPMLRQPEARLVETILHELLHATVFVPGEADFNEGVAAFVGQEARVRFYRAREGAERAEQERRAIARQRQLRAELLLFRREVAALYADELASGERDARRADLEAAARERILARAGPGSLLAREPERLRLGDACLALIGTYHADMPRLAAVLDALGGDLALFVSRLREAAESPAPRETLLGDGS